MVGCHVTDAIVTECHSVAEYPHNPFAVLSIPAAGTGRFKHNFAFYRGGIVGDNGTTVQGGTIIARSVRQLAASLSPDAAKLIKEVAAVKVEEANKPSLIDQIMATMKEGEQEATFYQSAALEFSKDEMLIMLDVAENGYHLRSTDKNKRPKGGPNS